MTTEMQERFLRARYELIRRRFSNLNTEQQRAVLTTEGPLLLLAGAGSGKTTVLIHRVANLLEFGSGSDSTEIPPYVTEANVLMMEQALAEGDTGPEINTFCALRPPAPWNIIAITFTNKAADELKFRLESLIGPRAADVWAMTFHSACCRILRREIDRLGYEKNFTIYDTADSERVMKDVIKDLGLDEKEFAAKMVLNLISRAKDEQQSPEEYARRAVIGDFRLEASAKCYSEYQRRLREANALDFDDIVMLTVQLLQEYDEVREYYQTKFRYVLVDEYQDTNHLQYLLTSLLSGGHKNICVVGDDDQSIYKFRGATISNILDFEKDYPGAKTIRLEQNYRSTKTILETANAVIRNNVGRKGKRLWTENAAGEKVILRECGSEADEANFVADRILRMSDECSFRDFAVLYRTNAQSNALEKAFKSNGVRYRIIGGTRFFDRAEVKDMLAYLRVISNPGDTLRLRRIINNPPRGIGSTTLDTAQRLADSASRSLYEVISDAGNYPALQNAKKKLQPFVKLIEDCAAAVKSMPLPEFYDMLLQKTGYEAMLLDKPDIESRTRLENARELRSNLVSYEQNHPEDASLAGFLDEIALYTDIDQYDAEADAAVMMTMHAAKGLEFPHVFIVGAEEGIFPSQKSIGSAEDMEEERRLCYVAITRAKKTLAISYAHTRMLYGRTSSNQVSRFVNEIPAELLTQPPGSRTPSFAGMSYGGFAFSSGYPARKPSGYSVPAYAPKPEQPMLTLRPGDSVTHTTFGHGMVVSVMKAGNDALWEIAFDNVGTKRLMGKTASRYIKK